VSKGEARDQVLDGFFSPKAVAVVGAARDHAKVGHHVFANLLNDGFVGSVYPVNPRSEEIDGHRCYPSVLKLPGHVDLAVIVVPARFVSQTIDECAQVGIESVIVISAGFKEAGPEGGALERELLEHARSGGIRMLGPNCLGLISTPASLNASFAAGMPPRGHIGFMSQSGALGTAILDWAAGEGIGLSHFVSLGNKADITETDLVQAWWVDPETRVVVAYLESVSSGLDFVRAACQLSADKPFIVLKSGGSDAGARAVSSHTGSLAGSETAYDAAFRKAGIIRAQSVQDLFDLATGFSLQPIPDGPGVAILTNAGGPAVMATDACERAGVVISSLEHDTIDALRNVLPAAAALYNPVDILGDAPASRYEAAAAALYADPNVRAVLAILTPQATTEPVKTARALVSAARKSGVTTVACFMGHDSVKEAWDVLRAGSIPVYTFPERAVATLAAMERHRERLTRPVDEPRVFNVDKETVAGYIAEAKTAGRAFIAEERAAQIAEAYGIPVPKGGLARNLEAALGFAEEAGYPVVMKIASPDILHKSDVGGLRVGIENPAELEDAYDDVIAKSRSRMPDAVIWGVQIQEMVSAGREVIIGVDRDAQFGPMLMFGLGGIYVEVMKDVTFRLCPVGPREARDMLRDIRSFGLLRGARGQRPADLDSVTDVIERISRLVTDFPEIIELDINPLIVSDAGHGCVAADIRIGIGGQ
jgi:acetyl coenzyme A synthetase (ADP forming)-like protein